jgi:hypothetical protein
MFENPRVGGSIPPLGTIYTSFINQVDLLARLTPLRFDGRGFHFACSPRDLPAANWTILK